jgi:putative intracellular protease/amidase
MTQQPGQPDSPAAELRAAAQLLRERAAATTAGDWRAMPDVLIGGWAVAASPTSDEGPYFGTFIGEGDARWIALMHPGVGEPLADWLERQAATWSTSVPVHDTCTPATCTATAALAVARALLGTAR